MKQARGADGSPANRREAIADDEEGWITAEGGEITNHESKTSWTYHSRSALPHGRRLVKLTWAYKVKRNLTKKARLCVQGCTQIPGVDYHQTFCAAMRVASLRVLCAISARLPQVPPPTSPLPPALLTREVIKSSIRYHPAPVTSPPVPLSASLLTAKTIALSPDSSPTAGDLLLTTHYSLLATYYLLLITYTTLPRCRNDVGPCQELFGEVSERCRSKTVSDRHDFDTRQSVGAVS